MVGRRFTGVVWYACSRGQRWCLWHDKSICRFRKTVLVRHVMAQVGSLPGLVV